MSLPSRLSRKPILLGLFTLTFGFVVVSQALNNTEGGLLEASLAVAGLILVPSIPVATGVAILKYRLYDIDLLINRALV